MIKKEATLHVDYHPIKGCKHPELTYGEICVKCGECGRFDVDNKCINCGYTEGRKPLSVYNDWGTVEFYDIFAAPICPKCKSLFKEEDRTRVKSWWEAEVIPCHIKDFIPRSG